VLWIRQGKDTLAVGNITGALVFQASVATVVALVFAPQTWAFADGSRIAFASAAIAIASIVAVFWPLLRGRAPGGRRLLLGALFYVAYLGLLVAVEIA